MPTTFRLEDRELQLRCERAGLRESRPWSAADRDLLDGCARAYRAVLRRADVSGDDGEHALLRLGRELRAWLDGPQGWLEALRPQAGSGPWTVEFATPLPPDDGARIFLQAPWELLAEPGAGHWAAGPGLGFVPLRRPARTAWG